MAYFPGDRPADDVVLEPARGVEGFDTATAELLDPAGQPVPSAGFLAAIVEGSVVVEWPGDGVLAAPGRYLLVVTLENSETGARERAAMQPVIVEREDGWATLEYARDQWVAAEQLPDSMLWEVLEVARQQVIEYAPRMGVGERPPLHYVRGQLMQARNIWNAASVNPGSGSFGDDGFAVQPFPLDWMVKQVLRPRHGLPVFG